METKQTILRDKLEEYLKANKQEKGEILDHLAGVTGMRRKAIIRRLHELQLADPARVDQRGREELYGPAVTIALKEIWTLFHELCGERLKAQLSEYVSVLKRQGEWHHSEATTILLLKMNLATVKRRIVDFRKSQGQKQKGQGTTKPSLLKEIIPIRRGPWDNPPPGYGEVDTVAHCGASISGDFLYSVQYTDVSTIWTCLSAQWNKGQRETLKSIERAKERLPFPLLGLDPDSGSEFINWHLKEWCDQQTPPVELTRTRPYRKNDHARIEQKNYTNIREFVGYVRLDDQRKVKLLNELYLELEDYINFFLPSVKCVSKERQRNKYKRIYDQAQTAYQRVLAHPKIDDQVKDQLRTKYATLNPKVLKDTIDRMLTQILNNTHY